MKWPYALAVISAAVACSTFGSDAPDAPPASPEAGADGAVGSDSGLTSADGASADQNVAPTFHTCPLADTIICDDFESSEETGSDGGLWGAHPETVIQNGQLSFIEEGGNHFMHAHLDAAATGKNGAFGARPFKPSIPATIALRARVRLPAAPPTGVHVLRLRGRASAAPDTAIFDHSAVVPDGGEWQAETLTAAADSVDTTVDSMLPAALGAWSCIELDVKLVEATEADHAGHVTLFVDGVKFADADRKTLDPGLGQIVSELVVQVGALTSDAVPAPVDFDIDDVVVRISPDLTVLGKPLIGCP